MSCRASRLGILKTWSPGISLRPSETTGWCVLVVLRRQRRSSLITVRLNSCFLLFRLSHGKTVAVSSSPLSERAPPPLTDCVSAKNSHAEFQCGFRVRNLHWPCQNKNSCSKMQLKNPKRKAQQWQLVSHAMHPVLWRQGCHCACGEQTSLYSYERAYPPTHPCLSWKYGHLHHPFQLNRTTHSGGFKLKIRHVGLQLKQNTS